MLITTITDIIKRGIFVNKVRLREPDKISELIEMITKNHWIINPSDFSSKHLGADTGYRIFACIHGKMKILSLQT